MLKIMVINGPNLNLLGQREPEIYGNITLNDIEKLCQDQVAGATIGQQKVGVDFRQSNNEGEIVSYVQELASDDNYIGLVINAAAYTHTSVAIHDAIKAIGHESLGMKIIEVHISNIYAREEFRHFSFLSSIVNGVICGLGIKGYAYAIEDIINSK